MAFNSSGGRSPVSTNRINKKMAPRRGAVFHVLTINGVRRGVEPCVRVPIRGTASHRTSGDDDDGVYSCVRAEVLYIEVLRM
jgi:hypothetical protein